MQWMTYARKATRPATAAKPNDAWMPEAAPVKVLLDGPTGEPVAAGLVEFYYIVNDDSIHVEVKDLLLRRQRNRWWRQHRLAWWQLGQLMLLLRQ